MPSDPHVPSQGQRTLAAIVVTDAVGFSARMSADEDVTLQLIRRDLMLMAEQCQGFEGQVLKSTGDGLLMYFVSAVQAVSCAIAIQKALIAQTKDDSLAHRIGIHLGDVFFSDSDVMGNNVNIAARLQTQAQPNGICISQLVYDLVKSRLSLNAEFAGPLKLKNIQEPVPVYHINVAASQTNTISTTDTAADPEAVSDSAQAKHWQNPAAAPATPPSPPPILTPGRKVAGRYTIKQVLGQGGFGVSYLVEDNQRFGELCVLKELKPVQKQDKFLKKAVALFQREAKALHRINHPQIPKFMACFTQAKRLFIVQEYVDGVTYLKLLQQRKNQKQNFTEAEVIAWLAHMLRVLDYLHSLNIMHRDISPENVMYSPERKLPVLIDFGLVNNTMSDPLSENETQVENLQESGTAVGKFGYSPPEQLRLGKCNPSSDLYALGVTAIVLLTGHHPRNLMNQQTLDWEWQHYVQVSPQLETILNTMIRQQPQERFQSARTVIEQLKPLLSADMADIVRQLPPPPPPLRSVAPPTSSSSLSRPDPSFIAQCRDELIRCIGPIADIVIEETLENHPTATPQEIVTILSGQISNADQAVAFLSHIAIPSDSLASAQTMLETSTILQQQPLDPAFITRCKQALARCVGPMASMILEDTLADYPNLNAAGLVKQLASEIPDEQKVQEFHQQLGEVKSV